MKKLAPFIFALAFLYALIPATSVGYQLITNAMVSPSAGILYSKLGTSGTESVLPQEFQSTIDAKGTLHDVQPKHVSTTDATVTTVDSFTLPSNMCVTVTWTCTAVKSDYTAAASYCRTATFKNNAGTVSQIGTTVDCGTAEDNAAWDDTINNSTTTIRNQVTGVAATNITWSCVASYLTVVP